MFAALPFADQLDLLRALVARGEDPRPLLAETAALADPSPFVRLLELLDGVGRIEALETCIQPLVASLGDAGLQHLLSSERLEEHSVRWVSAALRRWDLDRLTALTLGARWLRRHAPPVAEVIAREFDAALAAPPGPEARRALVFASGRRLAELAHAPAWADTVAQTLAEIFEVLARAPKSISQTNAERLLSRRVYADPGHFFFELLQNADDARATRFSMVLTKDAITIEHDGEPFSILDLVGVLSIGQTTKRAEQIGFFGVGFKSVYEVTDRPRVSSGALSFEIAHVSIPRALAAERGEGTRLVLPRREASAFQPAQLHAQASAIPPETLLTLGHVRALSLLGTSSRVWSRSDEAGAVVLSDGEKVLRYRVQTGSMSFGGAREEGRATSTAVLVAAALDDEGRPRPVEGPTLYAFLPTAEHTGLRVLLHARFDVTLDRERRELDSSWNDAILAEAGRELARLAVSFGGDALRILSSRGELAASMAPLEEACRAALADVAFLRGAEGEFVSPQQALVAEQALARALAGVDLFGRRMLGPLAPREATLAQELGAGPFGASELFAFAQASLHAGQTPPSWLGAEVSRVLAEAPCSEEALRALPLLPSASGLVAAREARVAEPAWVALYGALRPLVSSDAAASLPPTLRARLELRAFDPQEIADDLRGPLGPALLSRPTLLEDALTTLPEASLGSLADVAFVPLRDGTLASPRDARRLAPPLEPLAEAIAAQIPIADRDFGARPLAARLLPRFDLDALAEALEQGLSLSDGATLVAVLDGAEEEGSLSRTQARRFAALPLFVDVHGRARPLVGAARALLPGAVEGLLPSWPWLAQVGAFVAAQPLAHVEAGMLVEALASPGDLPPIPVEQTEAVLAHLSSHARTLSLAQLDRLGSARVWRDASGVLRVPAELRRGSGSAVIEQVFSALGARHVADARTLLLLDALGLGELVPRRDHALLVADLAQSALSGLPRDLLVQALLEAVSALSLDELAPLAHASLFLDDRGALRAVARWDAPDGNAAHRAGSLRALLSGREGWGAPWPLLDADEERRLAPLWDALAVHPPRPREIFDHLGALADRPGPLLHYVRAHAEALNAEVRAVLATLPLFSSRAQAMRSSGSLLLPRELGGLDPSSLGLEAVVADDASASVIETLGLPRANLRALLVERVLVRLVEGASLEACWPGADVVSFAALGALAVELGLETLGAARALPLTLSNRGVLGTAPIASPTAAARALLSPLAVSFSLADAQWSDALGERARGVLLAPLSATRLVGVLREHATEVDLERLYAWLRVEREALDAEALAFLGHAALFPSQRGDRRAPRDLVLDHDIPDLGLGWGLAAEVPPDIAAWLRQSFELDRHARRALTAHLLDGLAECARTDDGARAKPLLAFLARALGADGADAAALEERARRLDVRARLEVPVIRDAERSWTKPRFAWAPIDEVAREASRFMEDLPPRIALSEVDAPTQRLLFACGAREDLDDAMVMSALDRLPSLSLGARRALARYVITRSIVEPARVDRFALRTRAWLPRGSELFRPRDRVASNEKTRALLGQDAPRFIDHELARLFTELDPDGAAIARLGFVEARALEIVEVGAANEHAIASEMLLDWIEGQLVSGRAQASEVRAAFSTLRVVDDEGRTRSAAEVALGGARELFGSHRGDWSSGAAWPRTARALGIPKAPDVAMIEAFLVEIGTSTAREEDALVRIVPGCVARLASLGAERLPAQAALAVRDGARAFLVALGDPRLYLGSPPELAAALDAATTGADATTAMLAHAETAMLAHAQTAMLEPLPLDREPALEAMLLASGIPDLYTHLRPLRVVTRAPRPDLDDAAELLRQRLVGVLPRRVRTAKAFGGVRIEGTLAVGVAVAVALDVVGAVDGSTLSVTPLALAQPELLAPLLVPDPARRARFLVGPVPESPAPQRPAPASDRANGPEARPGLLDRVREFFGGRETAPSPAPSPSPSPAPSSAAHDETLFRPRDAMDAQLEHSEGWLERRRRVPTMGFVFTPAQLDLPWRYAPHFIAVTFHARGQRWSGAPRMPPPVRDEAGLLVLRGRLPAGESVLPVPHYGAVVEVVARHAGRITTTSGPCGTVLVHLPRPMELDVRVRLGSAPAWDRAVVQDAPEALASIAPDGELPDEVLAFVASLDEDDPPSARAEAIRDFVRARYRYDPSYLADPSVGHWLARITRGRPNVHLAALHASRDATHLGAGVCYELNLLCCELLRRAEIPAVLATGWVMTGGSVSEPDHLWVLALLADERGAPIWMPIDASTTRTGRPLLVPRRPPLPFRPPIDDRARAPRSGLSEADPSAPRSGRPPRLPHGVSPPSSPKRPKKRRPPRVELHRVLHHLGSIAERPITDEERAKIEAALDDPESARALLDRLRPS